MPKRPSLSTYWCLTLNNPGEGAQRKWKAFLSATPWVRYGVGSLERGEERQTPHIQGYLETKPRQRMTAIKKALMTHFGPVGKTAHLEATITSRRQAARDYCLKDEDAEWSVEEGEWSAVAQGKRTDLLDARDAVLEGMSRYELMLNHPQACGRYQKYLDDLRREHEDHEYLVKEKERLERSALRPWQEQLLSYLSEHPSDRSVVWVTDLEGGSGKSWLATYMTTQYKAFLIRGGETRDLSYAYQREPMVVFDIPRSLMAQVPWNLIEMFRDGTVWSGKYESHLKRMKVTHVLVMTNRSPDLTKLSRDRWDCFELNRNGDGEWMLEHINT